MHNYPKFYQGLQRVLQTDGYMSLHDADKRHLFLVSKGCFIISIPVESIRKHADYNTIKKIQKRAKKYPNDEALVDRYLDQTRWNAYKEVLMGRMIKDMERKRYEGRPGSMRPVCEKKEQTNSRDISRPATQQTMNGKYVDISDIKMMALPFYYSNQVLSPLKFSDEIHFHTSLT